jgi:hypothetical protein
MIEKTYKILRIIVAYDTFDRETTFWGSTNYIGTPRVDNLAGCSGRVLLYS